MSEGPDLECYGGLVSAMGREILKNMFEYKDEDGNFTAEQFGSAAAELFLKTIGATLSPSGTPDDKLVAAGRERLQQVVPADNPDADHVDFVNKRADLLLGRIFPGSGPWGPVREKVTHRARTDSAYRQRLIDNEDDPTELLNLVNEVFADTGVVFKNDWKVRVALDFDAAAKPGEDHVFHLVVPPEQGYAPMPGNIQGFGWC